MHLAAPPVRTDPVAFRLHRSPAGAVRRLAVLSRRDRARWESLGRRIAAATERRLPPRVLANRAVPGASGLRLEPIGPALGRARRAARSFVRESRAVLRADVATFYPSVAPAVLEATLRAGGADPRDARAAAALVEAWGCPGLPIGPPASGVMANAVLAPVDAALGGFPVLRWVDDYLIGLPADRDGAEVLDRVDTALSRLALLRAAHKTELGEPGHRWLGISLVPEEGNEGEGSESDPRNPRARRLPCPPG